MRSQRTRLGHGSRSQQLYVYKDSFVRLMSLAVVYPKSKYDGLLARMDIDIVCGRAMCTAHSIPLCLQRLGITVRQSEQASLA